MKLNVIKTLRAVQCRATESEREIAHYLLGKTFIASTEPPGLSVCFLMQRTTLAPENEDKSDERAIKVSWVAK